MTILLLYLLCGATAGFLSGLIGIGGGLVVVPLLNMIFRLQSDIPQELIMHLAVGTSLSSILFTAISSTRSHARMGGLLWKYVLGLSPAIVIGTLCASWLASRMSTAGLRGFSVVFLVCIAAQTLLDFSPQPRKAFRARAALAYVAQRTGRCAVMVAHAGLNRLLLCALLGRPLCEKKRIPQGYAAVNLLQYAHGAWRVLQVDGGPARPAEGVSRPAGGGKTRQ